MSPRTIRLVRQDAEDPLRRRVEAARVPRGPERYAEIRDAGRIEGDLTGLPFPIRMISAQAELERERREADWRFWAIGVPGGAVVAILLVHAFLYLFP